MSRLTKNSYRYKINAKHLLFPYVYIQNISSGKLKDKIFVHVVTMPSPFISLDDKEFYFIPSSEFNAYLKQIKVILSAVKQYRIFSLVTNTIYIFSL